MTDSRIGIKVVLVPDVAEPPGRHLPNTLRAFASRNFSLYWFGLVLSQIGTWMQKVAEGWLVYRMTNSALTLGAVTFLSLVPLVPVSLFAGVMADRVSRRKMLLIANVGQIFPPLILALLTWTGHVQVWHIVVIDFLLGIFAAIDLPTRHAWVVDVVPPEDVDNAISLSASGLNACRVIGPAIAGVIVAAVGEAICFGLNGISFLAVVVALLLMHVPDRTFAHHDSAGTSLLNGFKYMARSMAVLNPIGLVVVVSLFIVPYQTLLPVFAADIFRTGATGLGFLNMAAGFGAVVGALGAASLQRKDQNGALLVTVFLLADAMVLFVATNWFVVGLLAMVAAGAGVVAVKAISYTLIQQRVPDEFRGRVMAVVTMLSGGMPAVGGLIGGWIASRTNAPLALGAGGICFLVAGLALCWQAARLRQERAG